MINFFATQFLNFFDYFHKLKIIKKLRKINNKFFFRTIFDIGAHKGETIKLFLKNMRVENIYSFEPSTSSFRILLKETNCLKKKFKDTNIFIENFAIGNESKKVELHCLNETSSSTINSLNENSKYFKKKENIFGKLVKEKTIIEQIDFKEYLINKNIKNIDLLKIDTEGYELEVLKGLKELISNVSIILFEHHYDNMIMKNYTFSDIHKLLIEKNFQCVFKIKMPFRKSFEYIYIKKLSKNI